MKDTSVIMMFKEGMGDNGKTRYGNEKRYMMNMPIPRQGDMVTLFENSEYVDYYVDRVRYYPLDREVVIYLSK